MIRDSPRLRAAAGPVVAVLFSLLAAVQSLQLWGWRPGVALSLAGDSPQVLVQVDAILRSDWYRVNHEVGAPFGLNQAWFTTADVINFGAIKVLGLFTESAATASAVFFVLGFPAAALAAYWLSRELGLTKPASVVTGVLFSVIPGHQVWFPHLWLAAYWMVPVALWLVIQVARGESLLPSPSEVLGGGQAGRRARLLVARTSLAVVAIGLADVYYVAFTLILLGIVVLLRASTGTKAVRLVPGVVAGGVIGLLCGGSLFLATRGRTGDLVTGALPASRGIGESELYAGKLIELILPWYEHRAAPLRFLTFAYGVAAPASVERPALGVVALIGTVAILWVAVASLAFGRRSSALWGLLGVLTLVSLAFYTRAGLGSVVALFVTPQIRTWSRFVVVIALLGLLAVGLWLSRVGRRRGRTVGWLAAGVVLAVGVLDQTNPGAAPRYDAISRDQAELSAFTHTIAAGVGRCQVFQLPVVAYPEEAPPGTMADYEHLLPSIASPAGLSWSYGAIRGTANADWQMALPIRDRRKLLEQLSAGGFCAVSIDRDGYAGSDDPSAAVREILGPPIATAPEENLAAYDLRPLSATLDRATAGARRDAVLRPVVATLGGSLVNISAGSPSQTTGPTASISIGNMGTSDVPATLTLELEGVGPRERTVTITAPGVRQQVVRVSDTEHGHVSLPVTARPGRTEVTLEATGGIAVVPSSEGRDHAALLVRDLQLVSSSGVNTASIQQFVAASPPSLR